MPTSESTIINHRHVSRFIAILSLYAYEMQVQSTKTLQQIAENMRGAYLEKDFFDIDLKKEQLFHAPEEELLEQLIRLGDIKREEIETFIKSNLIEKYNFDRLDKVIKSILQLAALELLYCGDTPAKIIIDEYVSLTKTFYENNEAGFVNKVIDVMARTARAEEI
jgi:transcription antitermination factor NusB